MTPNRVAAVLDFLSELAQESVMKDWLGGPEGNVFWPALLALLCNTPPPQTTQTHASLLGATHTQKVNYEDLNENIPMQEYTHVRITSSY